MEPLIFFIIGRDFNRGGDLTPGIDPSLVRLELSRLLDEFFNVRGTKVEAADFRVLKSRVPFISPKLFRFFSRSVSLHYMGSCGYYFKSRASEPVSAFREFMAHCNTSAEAKKEMLGHFTGWASFSIDRIYHSFSLSRELEHEIKVQFGRYIEELGSVEVNLDLPERRISLILTTLQDGTGRVSFTVSFQGWYYKTRGYKIRLAKNRPCYHVGTMNPPLSTLLVNLCETGDTCRPLMFEPFCGTGGLILEALMRGWQVIGMDVSGSNTRGCLENLTYYNDGRRCRFHIIQGSVFHLPFRNTPSWDIDVICTDPPYGRISSLRRRSLEEYLEAVLESSGGAVQKICFALPRDDAASITQLLEKRFPGVDVVTQEYYEHSGFTRMIVYLDLG
ncbi:MAG: TRM11 family SAM-dependent methyltransferase [Promethearchaeota archaeon]